MALGFSTALANAILNTIGNSGTTQSFFDNAILEIRTGSKPATADTAPSGTSTILASITCPADAMAAAASLAMAKSGTWSDASADATGTAAHFRIKLSGDLGTTNTTDKRLDGTITATGGGGDMTLDNTSIAAAQPVVISTFQLTLPA